MYVICIFFQEIHMEILEMIGWLMIGFLPTLGLLELSYQMSKITGKKGDRYPWRHNGIKSLKAINP
jgi:hypothetical protein